MRFAFAGIDFLGDVFETLIDRGWQPVKLFSRPCDGIYDFNEATVSRARSLRLPIQMSRILPSDLAGLKALRCDALVVAGYPWLVKGWEPHVPYAFNFHPSPLPHGRGPYPLFKAILDELPEWGVTAHALEPFFDTGPILTQARFALSPQETHDTLLAKCQMAAKGMAIHLAEDLPRLWREARPQGSGSYWPRITQSERTVRWTGSVDEVLRTIRAFGSIEAFAQVDSRYLYLWEASGWPETHDFRPGTLVHRHRRHMVVAARDGFVQITGWSPYAPGPARST
ncbi:methionyl-tRNA formyltransferase [Microvirga guangxiensis]|uniref:Methionyl-tRNA formyltransferase n=1 Tax=Microvirga guangxiensis TaxID=549386 RepID=A0A1G5LEU5_9HYPH|nr:formyltransferase family protein [Microvirga guangxiensis]SCZ11435.1 methionyl-tRNA formyltransferase [Microvirga guangxiensis]